MAKGNVAKATKKDKIQCVGECKRELAPINFYNSNSPLFPSGKVNICKKCVQNMIDQEDIQSVYSILQALDKPFFKKYWDIAYEKAPNNPWGRYITMCNSGINEFDNGRWKDSVFSNETDDIIEDNTKTPTKRNTISSDELNAAKDKFGDGYLDKEYILFEKKYQDLRPSFQLLTTMHEECLREYCINKVKEGLAKARGDFKEAKEWASMAKDVANSGKLNPNQMSKADLTGGLDTFGQMSRMVEQTDKGEMMGLLPMFLEKPKDKVDITLWMYVNYVRDLKGLEECSYSDIWEFYNKRIQEYEKETIDGESIDG